MIPQFVVNIFEYEEQLYIFPASKKKTPGYFYELPSLKMTFDSSGNEVGIQVLRAAEKVRNLQFEKNPFSEEEKNTDVGIRKWITFINKCRYCRVHPDLQCSSNIVVSPGYRSASGFEFGEDLLANSDDPEDIGNKVLQALKTYPPKFPKKKK